MSSVTLDSIKYTGSALLMRGIQFLLIPIYTSYLSPYEYGIIDTITIIAGIVNLVLTFEIIQGMAWNLSDGKDSEHAKIYSSTALLFVVFVYLIFSIGSLIFSSTLSKILSNDYPPRLLIPLAAAAIATMGLFTVLQDIARWHLRATAHLTSAFVFAMASLISGFLLIKI
jgi:O-antigen/teichoic acid export membrane protein